MIEFGLPQDWIYNGKHIMIYKTFENYALIKFLKISVVISTYLFIQSCQINGETVNKRPLEIRSEIVYDSHIKLRFTLTNNSDRKIDFHKSELSRTTVRLILVEDKIYGETIIEKPVIDDPPIGVIELQRGKAYSNEINIQDLFPSIRNDMDKSDIVLFWKTSITPIGSQNSQYDFGGYHIISKDKI